MFSRSEPNGSSGYRIKRGPDYFRLKIPQEGWKESEKSEGLLVKDPLRFLAETQNRGTAMGGRPARYQAPNYDTAQPARYDPIEYTGEPAEHHRPDRSAATVCPKSPALT